MVQTTISTDDEHHIIIRKIEGDITVQEVLGGFKTMLKLIENGYPAIGIVNDISKGKLDISISQVPLLSAFFKDNIHIFKDLQLAAVVTSPRSITIPLLVAKQVTKINIKAFSSNDAAYEWILSYI